MYVICLASLASAILAPRLTLANTVTIDGVIGSGEYGSTSNGTNQISTATGQTWYMTWDTSNLYVGITDANLNEAAILDIDSNPLESADGRNKCRSFGRGVSLLAPVHRSHAAL